MSHYRHNGAALVGTAVLLVVTTLSGALDSLPMYSHVPWRHAMGGLASALYVVSGILLFPRLEAISTMELFIAGQPVTSLLLGFYGLLGITPKLMTWTMLVGTLAVLIGAAGIVRGPSRRADSSSLKKSGSTQYCLVSRPALSCCYFSTVSLQTRRGLFLRLLRPSVPTPALHLNGAPSTVRLAGVFLLLIEVVLIRVL